jgi:hypothetical protein
VAAVALCAAGAIAIGVLLSGKLSETDARVSTAALTVFVYGGTALAGLSLRRKGGAALVA